MKRIIRLTEGDLHRIVKKSVNRILKESFEDEFNSSRDKFLQKSPNAMFGMEMKNDPNTNTMSCMGVSIQVDPDLSIDQNLEGLHEELMNNGYTDGDDGEDYDLDDYAQERMELEAGYDDYPY